MMSFSDFKKSDWLFSHQNFLLYESDKNYEDKLSKQHIFEVS